MTTTIKTVIKLTASAGLVLVLAISGIACTSAHSSQSQSTQAHPTQAKDASGLTNDIPQCVASNDDHWCNTDYYGVSVSEEVGYSTSPHVSPMFWDNLTGNLLAMTSQGRNEQWWCAGNRLALKNQILSEAVTDPDLALDNVVPQMQQAGQLNNCVPQPASAPIGPDNPPEPAA
jgi:hypothetical protein